MRLKNKGLAGCFVIAAFAFGGLIACNNSDYKSSDDSTVRDSVKGGPECTG